MDVDTVRELFHYDRETGDFYRLVKTSKKTMIGEIAGYDADGYRNIRIDGRAYRAHRLAWLWMTGEWPDPECDHINTVKNDNRWFNLRKATREQNAANRNANSTSWTGRKGVTWDKRNSKWMAKLEIDGRTVNLGRFSSIDDAAAAYADGAKKHFGDFARIIQERIL